MNTLLARLRSALTNDLFVQLGHGAGGYGMTLTPLVFGVTLPHLLYGVLIVLAWTFPKEYLFDIYVEKQTYRDGWIDQRSYLVGAALAAGIVLLLLAKIL